MKKLTFDVNIVRDYLDPARPGHGTAAQLVELHQSGKCEIRMTTRVDVDVPGGDLRDQFNDLDFLSAPRIPALVRLDYTVPGIDVLATDEQAIEADQIMDCLFPGADEQSRSHKRRIADVDHLIGHKLSGRDVFLTNDKAILDKQGVLNTRFGITVMSPSEFISRFDP